jgi:predicted Zn-dependent protease
MSSLKTKAVKLFLLLLLAPVFQCGPGFAEVTAEDRQIAQEVFARLLSVAAPQDDLPWPPVLEIVDSDKINAFAGMKVQGKGLQTTVLCEGGLLKRVVQGNRDRMAYVLGHELAHHILGHTKKADAPTEFLQAAFNHEQEIQADRAGMELALRAGFSYREGLTAIRRMIELGPVYPSFEMLSSDHPAWVDRLALLDREQADLWRAMSSFDNGVYFLMVQNYSVAERAFRQVTREFPMAYDAWVNLGYAQLMQYADALDAPDLRRLGVGQLAADGFIHRPKYLMGKLRGVNEALWADAHHSLQEAMKLKPDLAVAYTDLGMAFLLKPSGRDALQAAQLLEQAIELARNQPDANDPTWLASVVNLASAYAALGGGEKAMRMVRIAEDGFTDVDAKSLPDAAMIASALQYNRAMLLAESREAGEQRKAMMDFEDYLQQTSPSLAWWPLAYERYSGLCAQLGTKPKTQDELGVAVTQFRAVTGIEIDHLQIDLGADMEETRGRLGRPASGGPVASGTGLMQYDYPERGLRVMGTREVLAITLRGARAPALLLREAVQGSRTIALRVGLSTAQLDAVMAGAVYDFRPLVDPEVKYRFYPDVGLAVKIRQGRVSELVISQVPRQVK